MGKIDKETYSITLEHITIEMQSIYKELNTVPANISNLEKLLISSYRHCAAPTDAQGFGNDLCSSNHAQRFLRRMRKT
nr:hypothetical protein [Niabella sp.]